MAISKSLWDISVELEASKLSIIPSTLDLTNRYVTIENAFARVLGYNKACKQDRNVERFLRGIHKKPIEFSFRNGFGRKKRGSL